MTLTYNSRLATVKVDPHAKNQGQRSNGISSEGAASFSAAKTMVDPPSNP